MRHGPISAAGQMVARMKTLTAAIYARYSTDLQSDKSIDDQLRLCRTFADAHKYVVSPAAIYADAAVSGASMFGRPALANLMAAAHRQEFNAIIVENSSRLSRRSADLQSMYETLRFLDVAILPVSAGGQPLNATLAAVHGLVDQLQREATADMVHRGMSGLINKGRSAGGRCYGYTRTVDRGIMAIELTEAQIIRSIFASYLQGDTPRKIAARLNAESVAPPRGTRWSASTLIGSKDRHYGILQNELYAGVRVWNRVRMVKNPANGRRVSRTRPADEWLRSDQPELRIIDQRVWEAAQARRAERSILPLHKTRSSKRVFSGLLRCGACGSGMGSRGRDTAGRVRIGCTRASQSGDCPDPRSYYADTIEEHVLERLSLELAAPNQLNAFTEAYREEIRRLQEQGSTEREQVETRLARVSAEIDRYTRYLGQGVGDVARLDAEIKSRMPEEQELKARLAQMDAPQAVIALHPAALDAHARAIQQLRGSLENGDSDAAKLISPSGAPGRAPPTGRGPEPARQSETDDRDHWRSRRTASKLPPDFYQGSKW